MEFSAELDNTSNICRVSVTGRYHRLSESVRRKRHAVDFHAEKDCSLFLFDLTRADIIGTTIENFEAAEPQPDLFPGITRIKTAFLFPVITDEERLVENVAVNRGLQLKGFDAQDEAVEWLTGR